MSGQCVHDVRTVESGSSLNGWEMDNWCQQWSIANFLLVGSCTYKPKFLLRPWEFDQSDFDQEDHDQEDHDQEDHDQEHFDQEDFDQEVFDQEDRDQEDFDQGDQDQGVFHQEPYQKLCQQPIHKPAGLCL